MAKFLLTLKPFVTTVKEKKLKYCISCANLATQEACFDVGENVTIVEKYCDMCAMKVLR
jgi:hypothetical protein